MPIPQLKVRSISAAPTPPTLREPAEHGRRREGREIERDGEIVRQNARQIVGKAAAGDMRQRHECRGWRRSP